MYAITFDMDTSLLQEAYPAVSYNYAYADINRHLAKHGFTRQQGIVYFGNDGIDPVKCVLAIQSLTLTCPWFGPSVRDIRMLRIEENNDLKPAIDQIVELARGNLPPL